LPGFGRHGAVATSKSGEMGMRRRRWRWSLRQNASPIRIECVLGITEVEDRRVDPSPNPRRCKQSTDWRRNHGGRIAQKLGIGSTDTS
jgi:hypothetical protein